MKYILKSVITILSVLFLFTINVFANNQNIDHCNSGKDRNTDPFCISNANDLNPADGVKLIDFITNGIIYLLGFIALIATILGIYGGFLVLTAASDDEKVKKGKKIIIFAVIGIIVIFLAYPITKFIIGEDGVKNSGLFQVTGDTNNPNP